MSTDPISWSTAKSVASRVARREPFASSYLRSSLDEDLFRLTREAEEAVARETGLVVSGPAKVRVVERSEWVDANVDSFRRLLMPLTGKFGERMSRGRAAAVGRTVTGTQLGVLLGWMSSRVLGQYVPLVDTEVEPDEQDVLFYVAPNMMSMEKRFGFPPEEFRLWIALHECTHRAQFTGVPWMAPHLRSLVETLLNAVDPEATDIRTSLDSALQAVRSRKSGDGDAGAGLMTMLASPEQQESIKRVQGLMALLEGHAEVVMSRAAVDRIPSVERFHRVIEARRKNGNPVAKFFQKLLGLDAKMRQYAEGANFVRALEAAGGDALVAQLWRGPDDLPLYDEILKPETWITRHPTDNSAPAPS